MITGRHPPNHITDHTPVAGGKTDAGGDDHMFAEVTNA
jgi:hypothetical protein